MNDNTKAKLEKIILEVMVSDDCSDIDDDCKGCKFISEPQDRKALSNCDRVCNKYKENLLYYDYFHKCTKCLAAPFVNALDSAGYRKQSDTVKEFAEKLKDGLDRKCRDHGATDMRILQTQGNILYKAYQLIDDLAAEYGKEAK